MYVIDCIEIAICVLRVEAAMTAPYSRALEHADEEERITARTDWITLMYNVSHCRLDKGHTSVAPAAIATTTPSISAISWNESGRIDVFGVAPDDSVWHKYHVPNGGFEPVGFEDLGGFVDSAPVVTSWAAGRLDLFALQGGTVVHKYFDGSDWQPSSDWERLLGQDGSEYEDFVGQLAAASWAPGRLDVVGKAENGTYLHLYYDGANWVGWENFGGNFSSAPSMTSWAENRFDIFGVDVDGSVLHKYWDGEQYQPGHGPDDWEKLDGGPFLSTIASSSWGPGRLDVWTLDEDGALSHAFWSNYADYHKFEGLGGNFTTVPQVVHWGPDRTDLVGQFAGEVQYSYKYYFPTQWSDWQAKGGDFVSQPAVTAWSADNLNILGIGESGVLDWQLWIGGQWLPSFSGYYALGNPGESDASISNEMVQDEDQVVLLDGYKQEM
ncbi:hypothetical protein LTR85_008120 [Meristemomyces frigidus]|nr:hypothetical protein LTR85_008120 [Meristemomyces frigidus]